MNSTDTIRYERFLDCVHCGLCSSACPTYLETGNENDSPRGRIHSLRALADGRLEWSPAVQRHFDLCLDCRACESACPSGVEYGRLIEPYRAEQSTTTGSGSWWLPWITRHLLPYPGRMRLSLWPVRAARRMKLDRLARALGGRRLLPATLARLLTQLPRKSLSVAALPERLPAIGKQRARVALFRGCVADVLFREVHWATARVLQANGCEVWIPKEQACCGALAYHEGEARDLPRWAERNMQSLLKEDIDAIVVNVAGCGSMLRDYTEVLSELCPEEEALLERARGFTAKVRDVSEFLFELGIRKPMQPVQLRIAHHEACHLCHAQGVRQQPAELLRAIPGLEIRPLAESDLCCGAAGSYSLREPEMSKRLAARKRNNILATDAEAVVTANAGCALQIEAALREDGPRLAVWHPMQLLDRAYSTSDSEGESSATRSIRETKTGSRPDG